MFFFFIQKIKVKFFFKYYYYCIDLCYFLSGERQAFYSTLILIFCLSLFCSKNNSLSIFKILFFFLIIGFLLVKSNHQISTRMLLPIDNFISLYDKNYLKLQKNNQEKITISPKSFGKSEEKNDLVIFTIKSHFALQNCFINNSK